jgi:hypothetical protein
VELLFIIQVNPRGHGLLAGRGSVRSSPRFSLCVRRRPPCCSVLPVICGLPAAPCSPAAADSTASLCSQPAAAFPLLRVARRRRPPLLYRAQAAATSPCYSVLVWRRQPPPLLRAHAAATSSAHVTAASSTLSTSAFLSWSRRYCVVEGKWD